MNDADNWIVFSKKGVYGQKSTALNKGKNVKNVEIA